MSVALPFSSPKYLPHRQGHHFPWPSLGYRHLPPSLHTKTYLPTVPFSWGSVFCFIIFEDFVLANTFTAVVISGRRPALWLSLSFQAIRFFSTFSVRKVCDTKLCGWGCCTSGNLDPDPWLPLHVISEFVTHLIVLEDMICWLFSRSWLSKSCSYTHSEQAVIVCLWSYLIPKSTAWKNNARLLGLCCMSLQNSPLSHISNPI